MPKLQIKHYIVERAYAEQLLQEPAYRDGTLEKLAASQRPATLLANLVGNVGEGLVHMTEAPMAKGTLLVCDVSVAPLPRPLRLLAEVAKSDSEDGRVVDRTVTVYRSHLKILAVNKDDLTRIENEIIADKIRNRNSGR